VGMKILKEHFDLNEMGSTLPDSMLSGNKLRLELWSIMNMFGEHLYNGCEIPFEDNEIVFEKIEV